MIRVILIIISTCAVMPTIHAQKMTNTSLYKIITSVSESVEGKTGLWQVKYNDRVMLVITDASHDRMRIMSPITTIEQVTRVQIEEAMLANFHSALDVRYAISEGIMWAAFIHPLKALNKSQVLDALRQVYRASETFGTSYSSSELVFPGGETEPVPPAGERKKM